MRRHFLYSVVALSLAIGGCGGGSGSTTPTPTPTPAPPPAPPPPPPPPPAPSTIPNNTNPTLTDLRNDQTFATTTAALQFIRPAVRTGNVQGSSPPSSGAVLRYTSSTQTYSFIVNQPGSQLGIGDGATASFGPSNLNMGSPLSTTDDYSGGAGASNGSGTNLFSLLKRGAASDPATLTYANIGVLVLASGLGSGQYRDLRPFAYFARVTPSSGIPQTGSAVYSGVILGFANPISSSTSLEHDYSVSGTIRLTINFGNRTYDGTITVSGKDEVGRIVDLGTFPLTQKGGASLASLAGTIGGGNFEGLLGGPNAEELAGTFLFDLDDTQAGGTRLRLAASGAAKR